MNILFVTELFNPGNSIGAVRPYNLATELAQMGHTVFCVISANERLDKEPEGEHLRLFYVPDGKLGRAKRQRDDRKLTANARATKSTRSVRTALKHTTPWIWLREELMQPWHQAAEYERYRHAVGICNEILEREKIDLLLTSYGPISNLWVGLNMKKRYPQLPWVSDMRDPMDVHLPHVWRLRGAQLQKEMLCRADMVLTVSDGITNRYQAMLPESVRGKVHTITNGYREEPILCAPAADGILRIGYTGLIYSGTSDMSELFHCILQLEQEAGSHLPIEVHYAGYHSSAIFEQARKYSAEDYVVSHGKISKSESLRLQETCDILCVLTWNTKQEQGVLTGKFMEYLRLRKPILAIVTGNLPDAEISRRIAAMRIGFSYECIQQKTHFPQMKAWLETALKRKQENLPLLDSVDEPLVCEYSYPRLAKRMEQLLSQLWDGAKQQDR